MRIRIPALVLLATPVLATLVLATPVLATERVTVKLNGLVCDFCARAIEANLKRRKDVERVHVDLDRGLVHLSLKDSHTLTDPALRKLMVDSGYTVTGIAREPHP